RARPRLFFANGSRVQPRESNLDVMPYGICPNVEQCCEFSYRSRHLAHLHDMLQLIQAQESLGAAGGDASTLQRFARFFQTGQPCESCGQLLCSALLPITSLDADPAEYERRIRLNHLLALIGELQARGVLRA